MIRCTSLLVAESAIIDAVSGKMSLQNITDFLEFPSFPAALPKSILLIQLSREENDVTRVEVEVVINLNDSPIMRSVRFPIEFNTESGPNGRLRLNISGIPISSSGILEFHVKVDGKELGTIPLPIRNAINIQPVGPGRGSAPQPEEIPQSN